MKNPIVGVMGSGRHEHVELAAPLGRWLASEGVSLLTGGGQGVMAAVSRAFHEVEDRTGQVIGILPADPDAPGGAPPPGYPNDWVELPIHTHLYARGIDGRSLMSRNHINILTSDVIVVLPGGAGTASEAALAVHYRKPVIAYLPGDHADAISCDTLPVTESLDDVKDFVRTQIFMP